jgi:hypothetical protein
MVKGSTWPATAYLWAEQWTGNHVGNGSLSTRERWSMACRAAYSRGAIEAAVVFEWRFRDVSGVFLIQTPLLKAAWHKGFDISGVNDVSFLPWSSYEKKKEDTLHPPVDNITAR